MPRFYAQVICKIATMVLYFGCSKEPSHWDGTTYVLVENIESVYTDFFFAFSKI